LLKYTYKIWFATCHCTFEVELFCYFNSFFLYDIVYAKISHYFIYSISCI